MAVSQKKNSLVMIDCGSRLLYRHAREMAIGTLCPDGEEGGREGDIPVPLAGCCQDVGEETAFAGRCRGTMAVLPQHNHISFLSVL